jgi:pyruvate dehydrogenase E1 component
MSTKEAVPAQAGFTDEVAEWIEAFDEVIVAEGADHGAALLTALRQRAREAGINTPGEIVTPYLNTIPKHEEVPYPGNRDLERRVESLIRWNAMAMVHRQNKKDAGIGGHISTSSVPRTATSRATLSTSRVTRRLASMRAPIWKAALKTSRC